MQFIVRVLPETKCNSKAAWSKTAKVRSTYVQRKLLKGQHIRHTTACKMHYASNDTEPHASHWSRIVNDGVLLKKLSHIGLEKGRKAETHQKSIKKHISIFQNVMMSRKFRRIGKTTPIFTSATLNTTQ